MEFVHSEESCAWGRGDFLYIPQRYIHYSSCRASSHTHTQRQAAAMHQFTDKVMRALTWLLPLYVQSTNLPSSYKALPSRESTCRPGSCVCVSLFHMQWKSLKPNKQGYKKLYESYKANGKRLGFMNALYWSIQKEYMHLTTNGKVIKKLFGSRNLKEIIRRLKVSRKCTQSGF